MKTLHLTTPLMHGPAVTQLQNLLKKHGWFDGAVDGAYGPHTAQSVYRAKYWLGYSKLDNTCGDLLIGYLNGNKVTPQMKTVAAQRLTASKRKPKPNAILAEAISQLGTKESPAGSNEVKYTKWYGATGAWCAMFCSWCADRVKMRFRYAYVPYVVADARAGRNGLTVTADPQPGDFVCYDWEHNGVADHIGIFEKWTNKSGGLFNAIEGNTAIGNDSNGGEVMRRARSRADVQAFVHVSGGK